ncbi:MAG: trigger factor [Gammaproteobacteria bacterium]|nr:trigger factor [Gammaproteobacteria bacterium]
MQVSVETLGALERRVTVTLPAELLGQAYDKHIAGFAQKAKIDGFRPGKAPLDRVKQLYGNAAREEAISEVIQTSLQNAIVQEKIIPAGPPSVEPRSVMFGQPFEYVATFEVYPDLDNVAFDSTRLEKETASITDEDIDYALEQIRKQQASWETVEGRTAQDGDRATIDFLGTLDGTAFPGGEAKNFPMVIGSKRMIPGFEEGVIGMEIGSEKKIPVTFPEEYHAKELAGKQAEFTIKLHSISAPKLPEIDAEFIKLLGVKSGDVADLRKEILTNLQRELDRVIQGKLKNQVFKRILEQNPIEVPKSLIEREANRLHDEMHQHDPNHSHNHHDSEMEGFREAAKKNVALALLVSALIKKHEIVVTEDKVNQRLEVIASSYEDSTSVVRWYQSNPRALEEIRAQLVEDLLVEKLLAGIEVVDKILTYREITRG